MGLNYDREADAAYLLIADGIAAGEAVRQVQVPDEDGVPGQFILDFGRDGKLLGLEILFASEALPSSVLGAAESSSAPERASRPSVTTSSDLPERSAQNDSARLL